MGLFTAGQILTAAALNELVLYVEKTTGQNVTNSATFVNDNELFLPVSANAVYTFECIVVGSSAANAAGDLKLTFSGPTGCEISGTVQGPNNVALASGSSADGEYVFRNSLTDASFIPVGVSTSANGIILTGRITTGGTAGTMRLRWAQLAANANATTVGARSYLRLLRVA
jgi:hypothetical protein